MTLSLRPLLPLFAVFFALLVAGCSTSGKGPSASTTPPPPASGSVLEGSPLAVPSVPGASPSAMTVPPPGYQSANPILGIDRVEGGTIYFKGKNSDSDDIKPLKTPFNKINVLDLMKAEQDLGPESTFVLFSIGNPQTASSDLAIFLMRADGRSRPMHLIYPGQVKDPKTGQTVHRLHSFYGRCLPKMGTGFFTFQWEKIDRRHSMQSSLLVLELDRNAVHERLIERRVPSLSLTQRFVRSKQCKEIAGVTRNMSRHRYDLNVRRGEEDDATDEEPKENQTSEELKSE